MQKVSISLNMKFKSVIWAESATALISAHEHLNKQHRHQRDIYILSKENLVPILGGFQIIQVVITGVFVKWAQNLHVTNLGKRTIIVTDLFYCWSKHERTSASTLRILIRYNILFYGTGFYIWINAEYSLLFIFFSFENWCFFGLTYSLTPGSVQFS